MGKGKNSTPKNVAPVKTAPATEERKSLDKTAKTKKDQEIITTMDVKTKVLLWVTKCMIWIYDIISFPVYFIVQQPWKTWKTNRTIWAKQIREDDPYSPCVRHVRSCINPLEGIKTMDELFRMSVVRFGTKKCLGTREVISEADEYFKNGKIFKKEISIFSKMSLNMFIHFSSSIEELSEKSFGTKKCLGTREVISEADEYFKNGKIFKKVRLADEYKWFSYVDIDQRIENLSKGVLELGLQPKKQVVIYAETRIEWMLICQVCFRLNVPVATLYSTLGEDGIIHGINETEVTHIFTSQELLPKLKKIIDKTPAVTNIVYMENIRTPDTKGFPEKVSIVSFSQLENMGATCDPVSKPDPPEPNDLAVIMYTSGSTGIPKGVMLTHKNMVTTASGLFDCIGKLGADEVYIGYLPLAHAYEISAECFFFVMGIPVGYSSPYTLTDKSTAIMPGCKGDASILKPTLMTAVPLMADRIRKGVMEATRKKSRFAQEFFQFAVEYKLFWTKKGFSTPILNRLVFRPIREMVGGNVRIMACGGAPLSPDTHDFVRTALDVQMLQAYGMTETAASATIMAVNDNSTGRVGAPLSNCYIKLVDWSEGNYYATDKPYPRGEIVVGGDCVTLGYFKNEILTKECFKEEDGVRWFYTGDIGELHPDGTFKIIDRKKDLVKMQYGEYISLGKVESELKTCPYVDNICVVGNGMHDYLVALVVPNAEQMKTLAKSFGKEDATLHELCHDPSVVTAFSKAITEQGQKSKLMRTEIPTKVKLCSDEWQPETGLVTAAFKIRRKCIEQFYQNSIDEMYSSIDEYNPNLNGNSKST